MIVCKKNYTNLKNLPTTTNKIFHEYKQSDVKI